jgi:hypothetical protein
MEEQAKACLDSNGLAKFNEMLSSIRDRNGRVWVWYGAGANGKTTLLEKLRDVFNVRNGLGSRDATTDLFAVHAEDQDTDGSNLIKKVEAYLRSGSKTDLLLIVNDPLPNATFDFTQIDFLRRFGGQEGRS